ncbi:MAG: hypothetical protein ABSB61_12245 [Anaerolineales bacterium]|jgi:uncharacterized membrane protein
MSQQPAKSEITSDDKLWAAIGYPIGIIALIMLLVQDKRDRPFIKFHAVQAICLWVAFVVVAVVLNIFSAILARLTIGICGLTSCIVPILWLLLFWPVHLAFQGKYFDVPVVTDFIRSQHWVA